MSSTRARHRAPTTTGTVVARTTALGLLAAAPLGVAAPASAAEATTPMPALTAPRAVVPATGVAPVARAVPELASAARLAVAASSVAGPDWPTIIDCESDGDPRAENPDPNSTASGLYQFLDSTWQGLGGQGSHAANASVAEQTRVANKQYAISGYTAWNESKDCWRGRIGRGSSTPTASAPRVSTPPRASAARATPRATTEHARPRVSTPSRPNVQHRGGTITVRSGDTLGKLAAAHGTTWRHLYDANRGVVRNPNLIFPGQRLAA